MHFMHGQIFGNCLYLYTIELFYISVGITLHNYLVKTVSLPDVTVVTDLVVLVDNNLWFTKHYRSIVNKANHRSSLILKSFQSRNPQLLLRAFTVFVRPMLDYCSPVWAPVYSTDFNLFERVQRRNARQFSFACRRNDAWIDLPVDVVNALYLSSFKNLLKSWASEPISVGRPEPSHF